MNVVLDMYFESTSSALILLCACVFLFVFVWILTTTRVGLRIRSHRQTAHRPDESATVPTKDGWALRIDRFHARGDRVATVVCCHGVGANRSNFDLEKGTSMVRYLQERGVDVFVVDLRGHGESVPVDPSTPFNWSFDDHVRHDVPAILDYVSSAKAPGPLHWIGHSMGGMVAYGHLGAAFDPRLTSLITLGSPVRFRVASPLRRAAPTLAALIRRISFLPARPFVFWVAPLMQRVPLTLGPLRPRNMARSTLRLVMWRLVEGYGGRAAAQMVSWGSADRWLSLDGAYDYRQALARVKLPLLVIAGTEDRVAPPAAVLDVCERVGSKDVLHYVCGVAQGFRQDHCHTSLLLGRHADCDVYALVYERIMELGGGLASEA